MRGRRWWGLLGWSDHIRAAGVYKQAHQPDLGWSGGQTKEKWLNDAWTTNYKQNLRCCCSTLWALRPRQRISTNSVRPWRPENLKATRHKSSLPLWLLFTYSGCLPCLPLQIQLPLSTHLPLSDIPRLLWARRWIRPSRSARWEVPGSRWLRYGRWPRPKQRQQWDWARRTAWRTQELRKWTRITRRTIESKRRQEIRRR